MSKTIYMISTMFFPSIGGVENHIYYLSKNLINKGYIVKIIKPIINTTQNNVYLLDEIEVHEINVGDERDFEKYNGYKKKSHGNLFGFYNGYKRKYFYNKYSDYLYNYIDNDIKRNNYSDIIIHQHDFISSIKLSKKLSKKYSVIFTNHTGEFLFLKKLPFSNLIIKYLTKHFMHIIAPSEELADFKGIRDCEHYSFIPNGVDLEIFKEKKMTEVKKIKKDYGIEKDKIIILCPRRWAPTKGIIFLVQAINNLKIAGYEDKLHFIFVGNDYLDYSEYRKEILDYINVNKIDDMISLFGNVQANDMVDLINCSDIVAIPSLMEAVSLSALEAMACGKIILSTNVGGFPHIILNEETGFMVNPKSSKELSEKLEFITSHLVKFRSIGKNAQFFVEENYSWDKITERTISIYNKY